jgi:hypothetical protein
MLSIGTDSKSAIDSLQSYRNQVNTRRKLRSDGHPYLKIISKLIDAKPIPQDQQASSVKLFHVKAHTDGMDRDSFGNRIADIQAKYYCGAPTPSSIPPLGMMHGYEWLYIQQNVVVEDGQGQASDRSTGTFLLGDPRKSAQQALNRVLLQEWQALSKTQGQFATSEIADFCRHIMSDNNHAAASFAIKYLCDCLH